MKISTSGNPTIKELFSCQGEANKNSCSVSPRTADFSHLLETVTTVEASLYSQDGS